MVCCKVHGVVSEMCIYAHFSIITVMGKGSARAMSKGIFNKFMLLKWSWPGWRSCPMTVVRSECHLSNQKYDQLT